MFRPIFSLKKPVILVKKAKFGPDKYEKKYFLSFPIQSNESLFGLHCKSDICEQQKKYE